MYVSPSAVSAALKAIGGVYSGVKTAYKFYQTTQSFGADFEDCKWKFQLQEWNFGSQLELFKESLAEVQVLATVNPGKETPTEAIVDAINSLVDLFTRCYEIIEKFSTECVKKGCDHKPKKLQKKPRGNVIANGSVNDVENVQAPKTTEPEGQKKSVHSTGQTVSFVPPKSGAMTGASLSRNSIFGQMRDGREARAKATQEGAGYKQRGLWAYHGQEEFIDLLVKLKEGNKELRKSLPLLASKEDPFKKIRLHRQETTLWNDGKEIRATLATLDTTMRRIDRETEARNVEPLTLAVKLEEDPKKIKAWMASNNALDPFVKPDSTIISILPRNFAANIILVTSLSQVGSRSGSKIATLRAEYAKRVAQGVGESCPVLGHMQYDSSLSYLLHVTDFAEVLADGLRLSDIVTINEAKRNKEREKGVVGRSQGRICLAAKLALSHVNFTTVNDGTVHRHLASYRLFRESEDEDHPVEDEGLTEDKGPTEDDDSDSKVLEPEPWWDNPKVPNTLWVEFGLGKQVTNQGWQGFKKFSVIDHATELGILICQLAAAKVMVDYAHTANGLRDARKRAVDTYLDQVEDECGLFMRELVEICFLSAKGEAKTTDIIQEVASALDYIARQLKPAD